MALVSVLSTATALLSYGSDVFFLDVAGISTKEDIVTWFYKLKVVLSSNVISCVEADVVPLRCPCVLEPSCFVCNRDHNHNLVSLLVSPANQKQL